MFAGIDLGVLELYAFDWEAVYSDDGADYLFTRVSLAVRAMINGQAEVLDPVPGRPFNGPAISYGFDALTAPTPHDIRGGSLDAILRGGEKTTSLASGGGTRVTFPQGGVIPFDLSGGGGGGGGGRGFPALPSAASSAGKSAVGSGVLGGARRLPSARLPAKVPGLVPAGAARTLAGPTPTNRTVAGQGVVGMNVAEGAGVESVERSTLRGVRRVANAPPLTHVAIRHRLNTPRGRLYVFSGPGQESGRPAPGSDDRVEPPAQLMLESPQNPKWPADCKNGPKPKVLGIHAALGDSNTLLVDWQCETFVNENDLNGVAVTGALLSNRFSQTQAVRGDGYSVIGTAGTALFRSDFVYALPESPDLKRPVLFMPIPQGFVREVDYVTGRPDCIGVDYGYTDTQVASNFVAGVYCNAASISAVHRQAIVSGDILGGALSTYERVLNLMAQRNFADPKNFEKPKDEKGPRRRPPGRLIPLSPDKR